jgi:hypothetical protein
MSIQVKNPTAKWYVELIEKFKKLMELHGMPDDVALDVKDFVLDVAREQYMAGNRSGIAWARKTPASA